MYLGTGAPPLLEGIQPHLGDQLVTQDPSLLSVTDVPSSSIHLQPYYSSTSKATPIKCMLDKDFIKHVDLPGLSVDDIEAVLSEHEDWSGQQIDQFLRSAIDLSEIESKLFSLGSYESDSGYSTYDVSPVTTAPTNLGYSGPQMVGPGSLLPHPHPCPPLSLGLLDHPNPSPLFGNPPFLTLPLQPQSSSSSCISSVSSTVSSLMHDPMSSPCTSDGGFFSPHSSFTPNHDSASFFPSHSPVSVYPPHSFPLPQDFTVPGRNNIFSINGPCFPDIQNSNNVGLPIPDIFLDDVNSGHLPCSVAAAASLDANPLSVSVPFIDCTQDEPVFLGSASVKVENGSPMLGDVPLAAHDIMPVVKKENNICGDAGMPLYMERRRSLDLTNMSPISFVPHAVVKIEPGTGVVFSKPSASSSSSSDNENARPQSATIASPTVSATSSTGSRSNVIANSKKTKSVGAKANGKGVSMKGKRKSQWPRSMNRANLMAFREKILNKLKKGQEIAAEPSPQVIPLSILTTKNPICDGGSKPHPSSSSPTPPLIKCEASSPNSGFEVQVTYERNHTTTKRCHSEPADIQNFLLPVHDSRREGHLASRSCSSMEDGLVSPMCHLNEEKFLNMMAPEDADNLLSNFNFNPDVLLSSHLEDKMLDGLGFKFEEMEEEVNGNSCSSTADTEIADLLSSAEEGSFPSSSSSPPSSSLGDVPSAMDMECIHKLLMESNDCGSISPPSASPLGSPNLIPTPPTDQRDFWDSCSDTPADSFSRSVSLDGATSPSCQQAQEEEKRRCFSCDTPCISEPMEDEGNSNTFLFPDILSVEGSMVLDGVSVISEECEPYHNQHQVRDAFLHSSHDPLLAADRPVALFDAI